MAVGTKFGKQFCLIFLSAKYKIWPFILAEKCTTFGSDLCFQTKVKEIVVKIGYKGTNDDVTVTFCSDVDTTQVSLPFLNLIF